MSIPCPGEMCPTVIDKSQPIESIRPKLRDGTRTFNSSVRARTTIRTRDNLRCGHEDVRVMLIETFEGLKLFTKL